MKSKDVKVLGLLPDIHAPYHNKTSVKIACNVLDYLEVDILADMGDLVDNYAVNAHGIDPRFAMPLEDEIAAARKVREQIEALGAKRQIMIEGNHETRLLRHVLTKAPALLGIVPGIRELLGFTAPAWEWHPFGTSTKVGRLNLTHCVNNRAGPTEHMRVRADFEGNTAIGHTHRAAIGYAGNAQGKSRVGAMLGCLLDIEKVHYLHRVQARRYWQQGLGVAYIEPNGTAHLHFIPIIDKRACVHGKLIRA